MLRFSRQWRGVYTKEWTFDSCHQALRRCFAARGTADESSAAAFTEHEFHGLADSALESLQDQLDALIEEKLDDGDVTLEEGVLTIGLGTHGTYVLNKQAPNKQIWSSSPVSGPARYDWQDGKWVYKRGGIELFQTLSEEMSQLLGTKVDLHDS